MKRFWDKVTVGGEDDCWPWTAATSKFGHGRFSFQGKNRLAHRVAYFLTHGKWPPECALHTCDNPPCCNPKHLVEGDRGLNIEHMVERNRVAHGSAHHRAKHSEEEVKKIKDALLAGANVAAMSTQVGLSTQTLYKLKSGQIWSRL